MKPNVKTEEIEFALQMLNLPDRENHPVFREWISKPEHRELFRELSMLREAGMRANAEGDADTDRMWQQFERRQAGKMRAKVWTWAASAAAVLALGFGLYQLLWTQAPETDTALAQLEYDLGKGVTLVAEGDPERNTITEDGKLPGVTTFVSDSLRGILYSGAQPVENGSQKYHTLRVPRGADYMVVLEDSTCVWINAETELHYPARFGKGERTVELKGEAYFKVRPDASRPFIVRTDRAETRVLGTEFNMQAYPGRPVNVTLVQGKVGVQAATAEVVLQPGENAAIAGGTLKVEQVDVLKFTSWKDGYFYYDNTRLEDMLGELAHWYNLTVRYEDETVKDLRFKFWAGRYEPLAHMLENLNEMQQVKLRLEGSCIIVGDKR